jgi:hypothetical protein
MLTTVDELDEFLLGDGRMRITVQILVNDVMRAAYEHPRCALYRR